MGVDYNQFWNNEMKQLLLIVLNAVVLIGSICCAVNLIMTEEFTPTDIILSISSSMMILASVLNIISITRRIKRN